LSMVLCIGKLETCFKCPLDHYSQNIVLFTVRCVHLLYLIYVNNSTCWEYQYPLWYIYIHYERLFVCCVCSSPSDFLDQGTSCCILHTLGKLSMSRGCTRLGS
jgi:hypothetical protein